MFEFCIDRGGTFTDIYCRLANGKIITKKLLSQDRKKYADAAEEGIRRIMSKYGNCESDCDKIDGERIKWIRMGTTIATNLILESKGERLCFVTTKGFKDLLEIGDQTRPELFNMQIVKPKMVYDMVIEVDERIIIDRADCQLGFSSPPFMKYTDSFGNKVTIQKEISKLQVKEQLLKVKEKGIDTLCVSFMHANIYPYHEQIVKDVALSLGFKHVSISSQVLAMSKIVPRSTTCCIDAYLTPSIKEYCKNFLSSFKNLQSHKVLFMKSTGGLTLAENFQGGNSILSGPAGGIVGCVKTTKKALGDDLCKNAAKNTPIIGLDMGGTSTDVSRYYDQYQETYDTTIAGYRIQTPQLEIKTIAAGGGSILSFSMGIMIVGPDSAGSNPGPACYRKGGPACITDANLITGRIYEQSFPKIFGSNSDQGLSVEDSITKLMALTDEINAYYVNQINITIYAVAEGFLQVANESMCRPIRSLTQGRGYDLSKHVLSCFGGASSQHACSLAKKLGISKIFISRYAGILSAVGLYYADMYYEEQVSASVCFSKKNFHIILSNIEKLKECLNGKVAKDNNESFPKEILVGLNMRYTGTSYPLFITTNIKDSFFKSDIKDNLIINNYNLYNEMEKLFLKTHKCEFGFILPDRTLIVDDVKLKYSLSVSLTDYNDNESKLKMHHVDENIVVYTPMPNNIINVYFDGKFQPSNVYDLNDLKVGAEVVGPSLICVDTTTIFVEKMCCAKILEEGNVLITTSQEDKKSYENSVDPIQLSFFAHRFMSIAEQMGVILQKTSISTNIKERLDFSCALFTANGDLVANAPHIPVHLGAMSTTVKAQIKKRGIIEKGTSILCNHPSMGGSHLPDFTVINPVYINGLLEFFVANRAHHADIGGTTPGSMPSNSRFIWEEGVQFESFILTENEKFREAELREKLQECGKFPGCFAPRNIDENVCDVKSQLSANIKGIKYVCDLVKDYNIQHVRNYMEYIQKNTQYSVSEMLKQIADKVQCDQISKDVNICKFGACDYMDDGSKIDLKVEIDKQKGTAIFDFSSSSDNVYGNINTPTAVTYAAIIYSLRSMLNKEIPLNSGFLKPIKVVVKEGSILNPNKEMAVVGGNVQTSQRVVDVIYKAFACITCAASQGPGWDGTNAVHTHMTNTRLTDPEIFEQRYPVILQKSAIRDRSGGKGKFKGGNGVERVYQFRKKLTLSILTERRVFKPYGLEGGGSGKRGKNSLVRNGNVINLSSKSSVAIEPNDLFHLKTPGGGGKTYHEI